MTQARKIEKLDLFGVHRLRAESPPRLEHGGKVSYEPGERSYIVSTCHRGMKSGRYPAGYPLTYLGMFAADETFFEVWIEELWFDSPDAELEVTR